ncbi:uncharacterized protein LOC144471075 isoform X2 [Augochlora pura]
MEEFKETYSGLYNLLCATGLWPMDEPGNTFQMMSKRIAIPLATFLCLVIQYSTLFSIEFTLDQLVSTMAFSGPMVLFFVRYVSFLLANSTIRSLFSSMENDLEEWKDTIELMFFQQFIVKAKHLYYYYFRLVTFSAVSMAIAMILENLKTTCVCLHIMFVYCVGIYCVLSTEISICACSHHVCGILRTAGYIFNDIYEFSFYGFICHSTSRSRLQDCIYKITTSVNDLAKSTTAQTINIQPAMKLHLQAINMIETMAQDLGLSYMVTIVAAVVSFALNLCRIFLAIADAHNFDEAVVPFLIILTHVIMMFLTNHSGQVVSNTSLEIFDAAYNSLWYYAPLNARKLVLFVMLKSSRALDFRLLSLYTAGYEGCSMMLSTSFSYFTVLYSVH